MYLLIKIWRQKSSNVKLMENNDWEITALKNNDHKPVIIGRPLFSLKNNVPENRGR